MFVLSIGLVGIVLLVLCACLQNSTLSKVKLSRKVTVATASLLFVVVSFVTWWELSESRSVVVSSSNTLMMIEATNHSLDVGQLSPAFEAAGWLNNQPASVEDLRGKITVVDLWGRWCPYCNLYAPGLVEIHAKFASRGIMFVSMTTDSMASAKDFVRRFSIQWLSGYQTSSQTIAKFNASNVSVMTPGYEVRPTIYLIGVDGRVLWSDNHSRFRHRDAAEALQELELEIEKALNQSSSQELEPSDKISTPGLGAKPTVLRDS